MVSDSLRTMTRFPNLHY